MHYVGTSPTAQGGPAKFNFYLVKSIIVGALGGLLFGFDTAVIAGAEQQLIQVFGLSNFQLGITVSIALVGTILGAMFAGELGDRIGGRESLRILAAFYVISALGCAFAWSWPALLVFRFIGGLGIGGSSVLGPVYIAEIAPAKWRGLMVGTFQVNVVIGILVAYLSNYIIGRFDLGINEWRWMLGVAAAPAALFFVMLFTIPRSVRWLVTKNRIPEAREVLDLLGSPDGASELDDIIESIHVDGVAHSESLFQRKYLTPIFLAVTVAAFNQLAGINAILYYLNDIFGMAGFTSVAGYLNAVGIGAMNLVATLFAMTIIDRVGRRTLLLIGGVGLTLCLGGIAAMFFTRSHFNLLPWVLVAYIGFFAISQGAVIWVYISEVFPNRVRSKGQSLGSSTHWIMNAIISGLFPVLAARSAGLPFLLFAAMMALMFFVVLFTYPETKGVTLEQMQHKLGIEY